MPIARLNSWTFPPSKRFSFVRNSATFRESKRVAIRSLRRKWRASKGMSRLPRAIQAPSRERMSLGSALSRFPTVFSLSVCPYLLILPHRRTKGESDKIRHHRPASETSRRDPDPQGPCRATATALDDERNRRRGLLSVHPQYLPDRSGHPESQSHAGTHSSLEADEEVAVIYWWTQSEYKDF